MSDARDTQRRVVTILFADAQGSTALGEQLDEEEVYELARVGVGHMSRAVEAHHGLVNQFLGDGIMAIFGAPLSFEESPRRAVAAALAMQQALEAEAEERRCNGRPGFRYRVGVHTGPAVIGGLPGRSEVSAFGDTANVAARIQQAAEAGAVYVGEQTYRLVRDYAEFNEIGQVSVKGKREPVRVWRALRMGPAVSRLDAAARRGLTPLVGRIEDLAALRGHLNQSASGQGRAVLLAGEAGVGKSRLLREMKSTWGGRWFETTCDCGSEVIPYLPIVGLLWGVFGITDRDDEGDVVARIDHAAARWTEDSRRGLPFLRFLLNVHALGGFVQDLSPVERAAGVADAMGKLVAELARESAVVLCVEDLHWADRSSQDLFAALADGLGERPVLIVATQRLGHWTALVSSSNVHRLTVDPLQPDETAELAALALGVTTLPTELADLVAAKTDGNPLFTEEMTQSLVEEGLVELRDGRAALTRPIDVLRIPDRVQDVILARIDRLTRAEREVLQLAAVVGRQFSARLVAHVAGQDRPIEEAFGKLRTAELVVQIQQYPDVVYRFKHPFTHEVTYSTLLLERRRALHKRVGEAIEELFTERLSEHFGILAHHFSEGRDWEKAFGYSLQAARAAADSYANQEALSFYDQAFAAGEALAEAAPDALAVVPEERMFAALTAGDFHGALGTGAEIAERAGTLGQGRARGRALAMLAYVDTLLTKDFDRAEARLHEALSEPGATFADVECMARLVRFELHQATGHLAEADAERERIAELASQVNETVVAIMWAGFGAWRPLWRGQFQDAHAHLDRLEPKDVPRRYQAPVLWQKGLVLTGLGKYQEAHAVFHDVLAIADATGDLISRARVLNSLGWLYTEILDYESALSWNQDGVDSAVALPALDFELEANARTNLGDTLLALSLLDEAEQQLLIVERVVRDHTPQQTHMLWRWSQHLFASMGELRLAQGDADRALRLAEECLDLAASTDSRKNLVKGHRLRGRALHALGRGDEAAADLQKAVTVAQAVGNPPQLWRSLAASGRPTEALRVIEAVAAQLAPERADIMRDATEVHLLRELAAQDRHTADP